MINHDKAYILGLLIGGGTISNDTFLIKLPFKKWGMNPSIMNKIAADILTKVCGKFNNVYDFPVTYEIGNAIWLIKPINNPDISELLKDLETLSLPSEGFLLNDADLGIAKRSLTGIIAENFLSGIFDARASLAKTHRRFTNEAPVVSIEIPGSTNNFIFVVQLCSWLTELGSVADQILFNHPCQHAKADPTYKGWKKGFKIRFLVKSFIAKHSFAFQAKAIDISELEKLQEKDAQEPCLTRKIQKPSPVCIHSDINSNDLPPEVRNKLFFHYFHFCAVLNCKYAPLKELEAIVSSFPEYIFVLPRLEKGNIPEIKTAYDGIKTKYFPGEKIESFKIQVSRLIKVDEFKPYLELSQGIAYLFSESLNGKRHVGSKDVIIKANMRQTVRIFRTKSTKSLPIMAQTESNNRAFLVSSLSSELNQKLIHKKINNEYLTVNILK